MIDGNVLIQVETQVFLYFAIGIILKKIRLTGPREDQFLSELLLGLILPMNVFVSFYQSMHMDQLITGGLLILAGTLVVLVILLLTRFLPRSIPTNKKRIAEFCMLISNGSLIGIPLIEALCGTAGVVYANIFMVPTRVFSNMAAQSFFDPAAHSGNWKKGVKSFAANPLFLGMLTGFILNLSGLELPVPVMNVCSGLSGCMSPLALILVGSTLADAFSQISFGKMFSLPVLGICLFRLLAAPYLTLLICRLLGLSGTECAAAVLVNAAPVANTATIFCQKYHGDINFTSTCVFISTLLSFATLWLVRF